MAVNLSPFGGVGAQFLDNSGNVLTGGKILTYAAGTTTPQAAYTSSLGNTPLSNPIILNAAGRVPTGEIWLTDGLSYKFVLTDSNDVLIATYDNITGINSNFVAFTNEQEIQTATAGQTVFNLTTTTYQPGTNSLSVFVDGVNQYGPGAQYAYLETDSDTVTFINGLHVGALVKFTTSQLNSSGLQANAFQVSYTPPFTNSVTTNVGDKLAQTVSVMDFGAVGDGVTDDTAAIQAAFDADVPVYFPEGAYLTTATVTQTNSQPIRMDGLILADNFNGPALVVGSPSSQIFYRSYLIRLERKTRDWSSPSGTTYVSGWVENNAGVKFIATSSCDIDLRYIRGFDVGADFRGTLNGNGYNNITLGKLDSNQVQFRFKSEVPQGWCNNNTIYGGSINIHGGTIGVANKPRYGIVLDGDDYAHQNNKFINTSIEIGSGQGSEQTYMIGVWGGVCNDFDDMRTETSLGIGLYVSDSFNSVSNNSKSFSNTISFSKGSNATVTDVSASQSTVQSNNEFATNSIDIPNKSLLENPFVSDNSRAVGLTAYLNGYHFQRVDVDNSAPTRTASIGSGSTSIELKDDEVEGTLVGVGIRISNIEIGKPFFVRLKSDNSKYIVRCYDSSGNILTSGTLLSSSIVFPPFYRNNAFEKGWVTTSRTFRVVSATVAYIDIIAGGFGSRVNVQELQVLTTPDHLCYARPGYDMTDSQATEINGGAMYLPSVPTAYYSRAGLGAKQGQVIYKLDATSAQPAGWMCTVAGGSSGAAGTWTAMANLA